MPGQRPRVPAPMVSSPQVDHAKVLHYIGAGVAFPTSMLFLLLQSILTYRMAKTRGQYWTGHLRSILAAVAFLTLVFSILLKGWSGERWSSGRVRAHVLRPLLWQGGVVPGGTGWGAEGGQLAVGAGWRSSSIWAVLAGIVWGTGVPHPALPWLLRPSLATAAGPSPTPCRVEGLVN